MFEIRDSEMAAVKKIHLVANSHIDPVWLWDKYEGIDEVINTFRSACDRLDEYPSLKFTASSLCFYKWVADYAPDVFDRIGNHVRNGRWEIVGGWWIESDCNLPSENSFRKSADLSQSFVKKHFGQLPIQVAYSPDAFGHAASLPRVLAESGFKYYLFCRPSESEKPDLPSNLFYWEYEGFRVLCYRLKYHYSQGLRLDPHRLERHLKDEDFVKDGVACYLFGVGDHGGGPTKAEIEFWLKEQSVISNRFIRFSTCLDFFREAEQLAEIPVYRGDLHYHAVGCYSVNRQLKQVVRQAEHLLGYTERIVQAAGMNVEPLNHLWETTIFNQFHDILPGSCAPHAAAQAKDEMGGVRAEAETKSYEALKSIAVRTPVQCPQGEFRIYNSLPFSVTGPFEIESFMYFQSDASFCDSSGRAIPIQEIAPSVICQNRRWLFMDTLPARTEKAYWFDSQTHMGGLTKNRAVFKEGSRINKGNAVIEHPGRVIAEDGSVLFQSPIAFGVLADSSDTWSHGVRGFGPVDARFKPVACAVQEGPLASYLCSRLEYGRSRIELLYKLYEGLPFWDLDIRVEWQEERSILKMELEPRNSLDTVVAQGPGGAITKDCSRSRGAYAWLASGWRPGSLSKRSLCLRCT